MVTQNQRKFNNHKLTVLLSILRNPVVSHQNIWRNPEASQLYAKNKAEMHSCTIINVLVCSFNDLKPMGYHKIISHPTLILLTYIYQHVASFNLYYSRARLLKV